MHELIKNNKESIVDQVLADIPACLFDNSDLDISFCIDGDANVVWCFHSRDEILNDTYFYTIEDQEKPDPFNENYDSLKDMCWDARFIQNHFKQEIEDALEKYLDATYFS